ncbi:AAA family ATPase [Pectinatus cerevisiiphilus]|uniref:AAA family ATPase n=1 Tax=Pectinatus cerevisiiphilus TaxID=86956 RepID=UPI0010450311|nr:AAA family ATPase [Pectinatus cerevisiiphilus]
MQAYEYIPKLLRAMFNNDRKSVEAFALLIGKKLKKEDPTVADEVLNILSYANAGSEVTRSINISPIPVDKETRYQLANLEEPIKCAEPVLCESVMSQLNDFLKERNMLEIFLKEDIIPPNSILLSGQPGVGKTYTVKWLSYKLNMPVITLDLANSISSYLGKSGQNIKSLFQYAKEQNVILFLDEIDAIAKRRDDMGDLGELKRLVNVLLKELDDCPFTCIIIGATNYPELLDKAIWRRFDRNIELLMPSEAERVVLIRRTLGNRIESINKEIFNILVKNTKNVSAAVICKMCEHIKRKMILDTKESNEINALKGYFETVFICNKNDKINFCKELKNIMPKISTQKISLITKIPYTSVRRYLKG